MRSRIIKHNALNIALHNVLVAPVVVSKIFKAERHKGMFTFNQSLLNIHNRVLCTLFILNIWAGLLVVFISNLVLKSPSHSLTRIGKLHGVHQLSE